MAYTHYLITANREAIGVVATDETDALKQAGEMGIALIVSRVDIAMSEEEWNARRVRSALAAEYVDVIGYDPFEDDPTITVEEVAQTLREYRDDRLTECVNVWATAPTVGDETRTFLGSYLSRAEAQRYCDWENERSDGSFYYVEG